MICKCGSKNNLIKHVQMPGGGWVTLTNPMCSECREKNRLSFRAAYDELEKRIEEREAEKRRLSQ